MTPTVRIPAGPITPHGAYQVLHDRIPQMALTAYDESVVIHMLGGLSIPDRFAAPGRVQVRDLKGLIPPWRTIDQKGATQDGTTFITALYDAIEAELDVRVVGRDPADCRRVARLLMDSIDVKQTSRLSWFTHQLGYWWSDVRWFKTPVDSVSAINSRSQNLSLRLRADSGFWQSWPCVDDFTFAYSDVADTFGTDHVGDMGTGWTIAYSGSGSGSVSVTNGQALPTLIGGRQAVARKAGYTSASNNQVVDITIGTNGQWFYPYDAEIDAWARLNNTGTAGTSGVRLRLFGHNLRLSYFVGGTETVLRERFLLIPPLPGEKWRLVAGDENGARNFTIMRGSSTLMTVKEIGTGSPVGASNRSVGAGWGSTSTLNPPALRGFSAGDNNQVSQTKFMRRVNMGDQPYFDNYIFYGPGTLRMWNGPNAGAQEYVEFGPLEDGQVMYLRTDPRKRGVVDMTSTPPSPQHLTFWQAALAAFLGFATGNNSTPLATEIESWFGIKPPQGNPYSLLKGRWSDAAAIPAKSPGKPAQEYHVKVQIDDGSSNSKVIVTGTPIRRNPY